MNTPMARLLEMRRKAVFRLFNGKFKARMRIAVGSATCENAAGAVPVYQRFQDLLKKSAVKDVMLGRVGCAGRCDLEPLVTVIGVNDIPVKYIQMTPERVEKVFESHILNGTPVEEYTMQCHCPGIYPD